MTISKFGPDLLPTPLKDFPELARETGIGRLLVKLESERPLGNFKVLGGMTAGLKALAAAARTGAAAPRLICASDGNHGLAVAAAARSAGTPATIFLHRGVDPARVARIERLGAAIAWVDGTYDDAVDAALDAARGGEGLLIPDTSADPDDPVVRDVMQGYGFVTRELAAQLREMGASPTHQFIQAGVGGLAAAMAEEMAQAATVVVEPERCACVAHALRTGRVERIGGRLETSAEMLSCGEASAAAIAILRRHRVSTVVVGEARLAEAADRMKQAGIATTPSGAAGLAGLIEAAGDERLRDECRLDPQSEVLLVVTEGAVDQDHRPFAY